MITIILFHSCFVCNKIECGSTQYIKTVAFSSVLHLFVTTAVTNWYRYVTYDVRQSYVGNFDFITVAYIFMEPPYVSSSFIQIRQFAFQAVILFSALEGFLWSPFFKTVFLSFCRSISFSRNPCYCWSIFVFNGLAHLLYITYFSFIVLGCGMVYPLLPFPPESRIFVLSHYIYSLIHGWSIAYMR